MNYEAKFPRYSPTTDLQNLLVLNVQAIKSVQQSASRIAINVLLESTALVETFPDYNPDVEMVRIPGNKLLLHIQPTGSYYYIKCVYDHLFPWKTEKRDLHEVSIVGVWEEFGDVSRIYTIDNMLSSI